MVSAALCARPWTWIAIVVGANPRAPARASAGGLCPWGVGALPGHQQEQEGFLKNFLISSGISDGGKGQVSAWN